MTTLRRFFEKLESRFTEKVVKVYQLHDEPKLFQYAANVKIIDTEGYRNQVVRATGASFESDDNAYVKCVGEAIERYACATYSSTSFIRGSFDEFRDEALNPCVVSGMSEKQKVNFPEYDVKTNTVLNWVWGYDPQRQRKILIPASLVYFNYKLTQGEKYIYLPITTGAAGYTTKDGAIKRGMLEVAERDAYTLAYFSRCQVPRVDFKSIKDVKVLEILDTLRRYRLKNYSVELTNDVGVPVFASILCDDSGLGPATLVGLGADFNPMNALICSMQEAIRARSWIRLAKKRRSEVIDTTSLDTAEKRGLYWYDREMRKNLNFWIKSPLRISVKNEKVSTNLDKFDYYWVDLTPNQLDKYHIFKVIFPELNPHSMAESKIPMGGKRFMRFVDTPNRVPNPFI